MSESSDEIIQLLKQVNISASEHSKIIKNKGLSSRLVENIKAAIVQGSSSNAGAFLLKLSQKEIPGSVQIANLIGSQKISTAEQLDAAIIFASEKKKFSDEELSEASGVGIVVSDEDITASVKDVIQQNLPFIAEKGKKGSLGELMNRVKAFNREMLFASRQKVVGEINSVLSGISDDLLKQYQKDSKGDLDSLDFQGIVAKFPMPEDNAMNNSEEIQNEHLKITEGKVRTRFPPEPNGWIHIGHSKAMLLDFGFAREKKGVCYMRFDDTNPVREKDEFIEGIKGDVHWMGFDWWKLTHTSDYFDELYNFAIELIKKGLAYVCHLEKSEVKRHRDLLIPSPYRDTSVEENLRKFKLMRTGFYEPSQATLRLKMDYKNLNPNMRDQVAYRIVYRPHPRSSDKWCIYPTYDYSHCIIDSIEHVTHSLCTLEFENRRDSYYWVLDALGIYKPFVWEFSRLNLTHTVMSKRRLQTLVEQNYVSGWDDTRMPTIAGFRRRGFTPSAISEFCSNVGYTRNVTTLINVAALEAVQRKEFDQTAPRYFCVVDPIKVTIRGFQGKDDVKAPLLPKKPDLGHRILPISSTVYIDRDDFMENPTPDFKRLSPSSVVGLKYANIHLKVSEVIKTGDVVSELICEIADITKANVYIHWVSDSAVPVELRLVGDLFLTPNVMNVTGDWKNDLNPSSLVKKSSLVEKDFLLADKAGHFQFERVGYFVYDKDSTDSNHVLNRTLPLIPRSFEPL